MPDIKTERMYNSPAPAPIISGGDGGIIIIADDFTGAAELAGINLRYGLNLPVYLYNENFKEVLNSTLGDGGIVCTDSRSFNKTDAEKITAVIVKEVLKVKPSFVYKKIDSVLRGHVMAEIKIQMKETGFDKALILPANPSLGRTIHNGNYYINGKKITETDFINDPEFPITSSFINDILNNEVQVLKFSDELLSTGIVVGEASTTDDIKSWAAVINKSWMLVGAGDFYTALLQKKYKPQPQQKNEWHLPCLYVCGTAFKERRQYIKKLNDELHCVSYLNKTIDEEWLQKTGNIIKQQNKAIIAINESTANALSLRIQMAKAVKEIVTRENIKELFIEGGSTAAAILQELNINMLEPVNELSRGVVRMKAGDLFITVKPGSYQLPEEIIKLYS